MYAPPATQVTASPRQAPKRIASATSFASALRDGLADLAYSFDGVFRPVGAISLAERASFGLRPNVRNPELSTDIAPAQAPLRSYQPRHSTRVGDKPKNCGRPAAHAAVNSTIGCQTSNGESVRQEATLRRAPAPDPRSHASHRAPRYQGMRIRAKMGPSVVDVIVSAGGRLASVMQWTI